MYMLTNHAASLSFRSGGQTPVPIVIRTMTGAGCGGCAQHSDYLESWFAHTPGIKVVAPSNPNDAYGLMRLAIEDEDPVIFIENLPRYWTTGSISSEQVPTGKPNADVEGRDDTIVTNSLMVS